MAFVAGTNLSFALPLALIFVTSLLIVIHRFGLLAYIGTNFWFAVGGTIPLTTDFSVWYATSTMVFIVTFLGFAVWGFAIATRGQRRETPEPI